MTAGRHTRAQQAEACAAKLPPHERARFLALLDQGQEYITRGWHLRKQAWALYRRHVPAPRTSKRPA